MDVRAAIAALAADPVHLIGVRHHSPTLARVLPALLAAARPDAIVIELPTEAQDWIEWIAHPDTVAPMAFAVAGEWSLSFLPFADFSPELVTLRWARAQGVPLLCGDLPVTARITDQAGGGTPPSLLDAAQSDAHESPEPAGSRGSGPDHQPMLDALSAHARAEHRDDVWDRLVEVPGVGAAPDSVRRSGLAFGWAHRHGPLDGRTAAREATMRTTIRRARTQHGPHVVAVTGAWHSPALTDALVRGRESFDADLLHRWSPGDGVSSLVPYSSAQLDSRSGYPSGIRDPQWQQVVLRDGDDAATMTATSIALLTRMAVGIRGEGHPAGPAEAREAARVALDLASLRGLPAPGRRELLEGCTTVFAQGDVLGRGRVVARVAQQILVGDDHGRLAEGTPRSGLAVSFAQDVARLRLPGPGMPQKDVRLEPLRDDRAREVFCQRCRTAGIAYAEPVATHGVGGADPVTSVWRIGHTSGTEATLARAGLLGVTVAQAATAQLCAPLARPDPPSAEQLRQALDAAARGGLADAFTRWLSRAELLTVAPMSTIVGAVAVLVRVRDGAIAGAAEPGFEEVSERIRNLIAELTEAAIAQVSGLAGSDDPEDARALAGLVALDAGAVGVRLRHDLSEFAGSGALLIQGAAAALLHRIDPELDGPARHIDERIRGAASSSGRRDLRRWLVGFIAAAPDLAASDEEVFDVIRAGIESLPDAQFVARLPALRGGFDGLTAAARERLLDRLGTRESTTAVDPGTLTEWAAEDQAAGDRLRAWGLADAAYSPDARWSLVLGRRRDPQDTRSRALARNLDQLYGNGSGEGSEADALAGPRGGREPAHPSARVWGDSLAELFGPEVREDVVAEAAQAGHPLAVEMVAEIEVRPSVELLSSVLSLAGGLSEATLARLRPVLFRMVAELSRVLESRLRPALRGLMGQRRSARPSPRLDAPATILRNLRHSSRTEAGELQLVVANPIFRQPVARSADWHIIVLVDVSGSMGPSTIFAAMTASIFAGVRVLSVHFLTFSTQLVDLSEHVGDPLALLLEIDIGGGTDIAMAVRAARMRVTVPNRTMVVVISDFEEGGGVERLVAEVGVLGDMGVRLLGVAALDDTGVARYNAGIANAVAAAGMSVSAVSPTALARWVAEQVGS